MSSIIFAALNIINVVAANLDQFTGGSTGMAGVPTTTTVTSALLWSLLAITIAWLFQQTRLCLRIRASREDEPAARALGIRVVPDRAAAFVLSDVLTDAEWMPDFGSHEIDLGLSVLVDAAIEIIEAEGHGN